MRTKIRNFVLSLLVMLLTFSGITGLQLRASAATPFAPFKTLTIPMVRYNGKNGNSVYAAQPKYRNIFDKASGNWEKFGTVGHIYPAKVAGTVPLLSLRRKADVGIASYYFYTTNIDEALARQSTGWTMVQEYKGVAGYVATSHQRGTIPVYLYRQPTGPGFLYAFGEQENEALKNSTAKYQKIAFYVWGDPVESEPAKGSNFPSANDSVDLRMREDLYFIAPGATKINTAASYASNAAPLTLKQSQGTNCKGNRCTYRLGFFISRNSGKVPLSVFAQLSGASFGSVGNSYKFNVGQTTREVIFPVSLAVGSHDIKVSVDPYNKVSESNDGNNSFTVKVIVTP